MKKFFHVCLFLGVCLCSINCGTAYITTDKYNDIYIDGKKEGTEKVEIIRNGFPKKLYVEIKINGQLTNSKYIKREITLMTFIYGWVGLIFNWKYPKTTYIKGKKRPIESIWSDEPINQSIWNQ